ncbi:hypothetical protein CC1G_03237 [Coprinopsis cinerea okayama7|uniref:BZIP domain-containing protein n=1 Tax=Coprinopsis cinerea (strain Okayama-7 / 130 / ATCC MYA-4618 / FGSC 9003) TaxID=240176 RepID=A8N794_COPC7|nr:hypothetical protein CC1G_03237 [Coprinopsis cinerea okayama7\|eukprot:XP_001830700.1 hypothetical protein CC1G_03237 [Coprinopsis cinerea okayama7\
MGYVEELTQEMEEWGGISFVILRNGEFVSRESCSGPEGMPSEAKQPRPHLKLPGPHFPFSLPLHIVPDTQMPPNLNGLNVVHPTIHSDSHDLLAGQQYQDLSAQLDLWTNLTFDSEDPLTTSRPNDDKYSRKSLSDEEEEEAARSPVTTEKAVHDGHVNVVTPTNIGTNEPRQPAPAQPALPPFDLNSFLVGFGIDPFAAAPQLQQQPIAPSLAQLLAFHSAAAAAQHIPPPPPFVPASHQIQQQQQASSASNLPLPITSYRPTQPAAPTAAESVPPTPTTSTEESQQQQQQQAPAAKRARTRKASVSNPDSPDAETPSPAALSAAEDKRRRNTAASARFRLKKKEREAALEGKAKELELKVSELERECEALRRENGWLKGLVVGVTGAAQGPVPPPLIPSAQTLQSLTASASTGSKRRREDGDNA